MLKKILILTIIYFLNCAQIYAQETVFNVPNADITEKGKVFLLQEVQFTPWNPDASAEFTTYSALGIGHNTEIDATLFNVGAPATENISLGIGFKKVMPIPVLKEKFPKREFKLTVGSEVLTGLEGNGIGNWTYAHLSGRVPKLNTRLTGGVTYIGRQVSDVDSFAFLSAIEQPVSKKITLLLDWYSGSEHFLGFLVVGGSYDLTKNTKIYAGYQMPNSPRNGTAGFIVQISRIF